MEPLFEQFFCCPLCRGLFPLHEEVRSHYAACSGSHEDSSATYFALPKTSCMIIEEQSDEQRNEDHAYISAENGFTVIVEEEEEPSKEEEEEEEEVEEEAVKIAEEEEKRAVKSKRKRKKREPEDGEEKPFDKKAKRLADIKEWTEKYKEYAREESDDMGKMHVTYQCCICSKHSKHVGFFNRHMVQCHPPETEGTHMWKCDECSFSTDSKAKFNQHHYRHMKKHMCDICSMRFTSKRDLQTHLYVHTNEKPIKCDQCDFSTRFQHAFKLHMRKHSGEMLVCGIDGCEFKTAYNWALKCHKNSRHEKSLLYQCEFCPYISTNRCTLIRHQKTHLGMREYACIICPYNAVSKHEIVRHMRSHSKVKLYFCDRCNFSTSYSTGLRTHLMQHLNVKPFQCSVCEFCAITKQKIVQHQISKHANTEDAQVIQLNLKLDIDINHFKRKVTECYLIKGEEVKLDPQVQGCVEVMMETEITTEEAA